MTKVDYMIQEKKKKEDLPALKTVSMHQHKDSKAKKKAKKD